MVFLRSGRPQVGHPLQKVGFLSGHDVPPDILEGRYTPSCRQSREARFFAWEYGAGGAGDQSLDKMAY